MVIHYDDTQLGQTIEEDLGVLWFDEENKVYEIQEQAVVDTENNTITLVLNHFSTYVLIDAYRWNNPIIPDYCFTDHLYAVSYTCIPRNRNNPSASESQAWSSFQNSIGNSNLVRLGTSSQGWTNVAHTQYQFSWIVMDNTDEDNDGVPDFMETQGVIGSNEQLYYSHVDSNIDYDGDGLSDLEELANIYIAVETMFDGVQEFVIDENGNVSLYSGVFPLKNYMSLINPGRPIIVSQGTNPNDPDTDGDLDNDSIDPHPTRSLLNDRLIYNISILEDIAKNDGCADPNQSVLSFIRSFNSDYIGGNWIGTGGAVDALFKLKISNEYPDLYAFFDETNYYNATYSEQRGDLYHFAATFTGLIHDSDYSAGFEFGAVPDEIINDISGWAGDYQSTLAEDIAPYVVSFDDYYNTYEYARTVFFSDESHFSLADLYSDADAVNINDMINDYYSISEAMEDYFEDMTNKRFTTFVSNIQINRTLIYSLDGITVLNQYYGWPLLEGKPFVSSLRMYHRRAITAAFISMVDSLVEEERDE